MVRDGQGHSILGVAAFKMVISFHPHTLVLVYFAMSVKSFSHYRVAAKARSGIATPSLPMICASVSPKTVPLDGTGVSTRKAPRGALAKINCEGL
jgi:hypothetical protein